MTKFLRTKTVMEVYMEAANGSDTITLDQATQADGIMVAQELTGDFEYVYTDWQDANRENLDSGQAAYNAGYDVCMNYEVPSNASTKAPVRATDSQKIYDVMKGK